MEKEIWRTVEKYPWIQVSNMGRVWNSKTNNYIGSSHKNKNTGRIYRLITIGNVHLKVHRLCATAFLENPENKRCVDHIDNNGENNNVNNLRWSTHCENGQNHKVNKNNKLGITGVYLTKRGKYQSSIYIDGKCKYLGTFTFLEDAIKARDKAEDEYFGEFKFQKLNSNVTISNCINRMII